MALNGSLNRKLRMALVGGGIGSFIGRVHSIAAQLDGRAELVAGAWHLGLGATWQTARPGVCDELEYPYPYSTVL